MAFNVSASDFDNYVHVAIQNNIKRVIFAVPAPTGSLDYEMFEKGTNPMHELNMTYTILKYHQPFLQSEEAKFPYRIVPGTSKIPRPNTINRFTNLPSADFFRVFAELIYLLETYRKVYGIGPGTLVDADVFAKMKATGWPEYVQVSQYFIFCDQSDMCAY